LVLTFDSLSAGVIDRDYRGNVGVILFNFGELPFQVAKGDRIAQLICEQISYPVLEECEVC
jgi:dUTP pyrophosphatase